MTSGWVAVDSRVIPPQRFTLLHTWSMGPKGDRLPRLEGVIENSITAVFAAV